MLKLSFALFQQGFRKPALCKYLAEPIRNNATTASVEYFDKDAPVDQSEWPKKRKLMHIEKQPNFETGHKPPRMYKMIKLMRGPEPVHTELLYKGFGVKALLGGRLKIEHFEAIRTSVNKRIDEDRMFAIWRVDPPWQPCAKKGVGKKMGGGKGSIHHYVTPVKANRIIVELGGNVNIVEARKILSHVCQVLPFPARFVSQKDLEREKASIEWVENNNINPFDMPYVIRNNMGGCHNWLSKYDFEWFGKYR